MHRTAERFWKCFEKLPAHKQDLANDNFELLKNDPKHPSLHFKKIGKFWSARVGLNYRALAVEDDEALDLLGHLYRERFVEFEG